MTINASDIISIASVLIAFTALAYSYFSNTKKYELISQYRNEVLKWYSDTILILINLKTHVQYDLLNNELKVNELSKLSSQIEIGRFYFPNIDRSDEFGNEKPIAYRGYRNLMLDFLVFSYRLFEKGDAKSYLDHAETLQRHFTSLMHEILDPKKFLKETHKYTKRTFTKELSFEDFIDQEPHIIDQYL